jgi:hypothetical protein
MVTNEKNMMKKVQLYGMLLCLLATVACNRDEVEDIEFSVSIDNTATFKVNEPVTFLFDGNAEYITFYSGEAGNNYANIERTNVDIANLHLESTVKQQYTDAEYRNK